MSRYDLETALSEFIDDRLSNCDFASDDHEHSRDTYFEDSVANYLGDNFTVGAGCNVQQAFEQSVRAICNSVLEEGLHDSATIRGVLRSILVNARKLDPAVAFRVLARCDADLYILANSPESTEASAVTNNVHP